MAAHRLIPCDQGSLLFLFDLSCTFRVFVPGDEAEDGFKMKDLWKKGIHR